jgi:hypothetical protein
MGPNPIEAVCAIFGISPDSFLNEKNGGELAMDIKDLRQHSSSQNWTNFCTRYSLGFTSGHCPPEDVVAIIDGLSRPCLMRRIGEDCYRIVGTCYLWATQKLDPSEQVSSEEYWITDRFDTEVQQAWQRRMRAIEIHGMSPMVCAALSCCLMQPRDMHDVPRVQPEYRVGPTFRFNYKDTSFSQDIIAARSTYGVWTMYAQRHEGIRNHHMLCVVWKGP